MSKVEVKLMERPDGSNFLRVDLSSEVKRGLKATSELPFEEGSQRTRARVVACAGAHAEYLDERYGDRLDPSEIASKAGEAYDELMADYEQMARTSVALN